MRSGCSITASRRSAQARVDAGHPSSVHAFAEDARRGDLVIAKRGLRTILGIGVLGAYDFDADIDTEGWDLSHIRRTRWIVKKGGLV